MLHLAALLVFFVEFRWALLAWMAGSYLLRMFGVTAGYHRYFSHKSYKLGRVSQFLMAFLAQTSAQKGAIWWASHHRVHHRHSDEEYDVHSPVRKGFWWSHVGWVISTQYDHVNESLVRDLTRYPELVWLNRHHWVPATVYGGVLALFGWDVFLYGFVLATVLLYHGTFAINSLAHLFGTRRFNTQDHSRNNFWLALITLGEGWHNNHHHYMTACRQGIRWWEIDITYYVLVLLRWIGIARDLHPFRIHRESPTPVFREQPGGGK
jgi:stearoyl-CoA desaturase (delta-9 desaturase)